MLMDDGQLIIFSLLHDITIIFLSPVSLAKTNNWPLFNNNEVA